MQSTLKVYVAAISAHHSLVEGFSLSFHSLVCRFLKGARHHNPAHSPLSPVWKLPLVLESLCQSPFETFEDTDLRWNSSKVAFLHVVASTKRAGELHVLSVSQSCRDGNQKVLVLSFGPIHLSSLRNYRTNY